MKQDREINGKPFEGEGLTCINNSLIFAKLKGKPVDDKLKLEALPPLKDNTSLPGTQPFPAADSGPKIGFMSKGPGSSTHN